MKTTSNSMFLAAFWAFCLAYGDGDRDAWRKNGRIFSLPESGQKLVEDTVDLIISLTGFVNDVYGVFLIASTMASTVVPSNNSSDNDPSSQVYNFFGFFFPICEFDLPFSKDLLFWKCCFLCRFHK